ncbi:M4 family metallopeptidase [Lentisphaerota bacterium ZTH]|nr:M4 family metallopeptidase [Lentisphaerota bacterium]WET07403.1 M4 family metallopeptidase [Lentisphaerota bacterium ZTH]
MLETSSRHLLQSLAITVIVVYAGFVRGNTIHLRDANTVVLEKFCFCQETKQAGLNSNAFETSFSLVGKAVATGENIVRYQQKFHGVDVYGAQIIISSKNVNGRMENDVGAYISAVDVAKYNTPAKRNEAVDAVYPFCGKTTCKLIVLTGKKNKNTFYRLAYFITGDSGAGMETTVTDAASGAIIKRWKNNAGIDACGIGGNYYTGKYCYGRCGLPFMPVSVTENLFVLENDDVKVVDLRHFDGKDIDGNYVWGPAYSWSGKNCSGKSEFNNAYNVMNDAFMFGNCVVKMYREYGLNCLESSDGVKRQAVLRVHYREKKCIGKSCDYIDYDHAFWDGKAANFGDGHGGNILPQVSLDVVAHELAHGFNESHTKLEYHDESGAICESFADISAVAAMDYVMRHHPEMYKKIYPESGGKIVWQIGSTVTADGTPKRYLNNPALDKESADCYDPTITGSILYADITFRAKLYFQSWSDQQCYIIHHGNGIFNLAFYILASRWNVQKAFKAFAYAATHYWTPTVEFEEAANGVWRAAEKLGFNTRDVEAAFDCVGVDYS